MYVLSDVCIYSLTDAAIQQVNWDTSKVKDKLRRDIEAHVASVRATKLSELCAKYEVGPSLNSSVCVTMQHRESLSNPKIRSFRHNLPKLWRNQLNLF